MKNAEIVNINLKELNGQTITLGQLIDGIEAITNKSNIDIELKPKIFVPMYQRNYKWNQETAVKLVKDLIFSFENKKEKSLSLFTLYIDSDDNIQVVDGQQRMVTLLLLFKGIKKEDNFVNLEFERDFELNDKTRKEFIGNIDSQYVLDSNIALTDKRRLKHNYLGICKVLNECKVSNIDSFVEYLRERVKLLLHITEDEPVAEFLNLNCNKTKFSICDRVRSALITYTTFNTVNDEQKELIAAAIECTDFKKGISIMFEELTRLLYCDDIYDTVKLGYIDPDKSKENRINIMFSALVNNQRMGYMECKSLEDTDKMKLLGKLYFYKNILCELDMDFKAGYYVTSNAFKNFYHHKKVLFFDLVDKYFNDHFNNEKTKLSQILHTEHSIDNLIMDYIREEESGEDIYFVNSYFQVLSNNEPNNDKTKYETLLKSQYRQQYEGKNKYFPLDKESFEDIVQGSGKYILYRYIEQHQKENDNTLKFSPIISLEESQKIECNEIEPKDKIPAKINIKDLLCTDNRKIIIPVIQRDYCMGSHFNKTGKEDMLDYIIKNFNDNKKQITLSAITIFQPNSNDVYIYDGQQRIFTLFCLVRLLEANNNFIKFNEILFEHRENFNEFIRDFINNAKEKLECDSYAKKSIDNLKQSLEIKLKGKNIDNDQLKNYVFQSINLDVIVVNGALSSAEQFFVEINDGVQLVPYEIFKCKINDRCKALFNEENSEGINSVFYKQWINKLDNDWLDFFYIYRKIDISNESALEELMEMRLIEFCCRMIYWENYISNPKEKPHPLLLKSFSSEGTEMGDMDIFVNSLDSDDFKRIFDILENLIKFKDNVIDSNWNVRLHAANDKQTGFYFFDTNKYNRVAFIKCFLEALHSDNIDETDIIIWEILKQKQDDDIKKSMVIWNNQKINEESFALLIPCVIGTWKHICLRIPKYYIKTQSANASLLEKIINRIKKVENEYELYDNVIRDSINNIKNQEIVPCFNDIIHRNIYGISVNSLGKTDEFLIFYFYKNDGVINFSEGKILMLAQKKHVMVYKKGNYYPLINQFGTRFLKNCGTIIEATKSNNRWEIKVKAETTKYIYNHEISCLE